jgi:hypothetical protein
VDTVSVGGGLQTELVGVVVLSVCALFERQRRCTR